MTQVSLAETFLSKRQYDFALDIFLEPVTHFRQENDRWDLMRVLLDAAKAYEGKKNERQHCHMLKKVLQLRNRQM